MSRLNRFYFAGEHRPGDSLQLHAERSNYLCRVLRKTVGDELDIFDGQGGLYRCRVTTAHLRRAHIEVINQILLAPQPDKALGLAIALLKGQAMDRAIQQATELGVKDIRLLQAERSNAALKADRLEQKLQHWHRIIISACEQCGQLWLPTLHAPTSVETCLTGQGRQVVSIVFDPDGERIPSELKHPLPLIFIGPEGGWSDSERQQFARANTASYRLGRTILRAETMPAVALALIQQARGWPD